MSKYVISETFDPLQSGTGLGGFHPLEAQGATVRPNPRLAKPPAGRGISSDFEMDLSLAGKRALGAFASLLETARDTDLLLSGVDGRMSQDRYPAEQIAMLNLSHGLLDPMTGLSFVPAVHARAGPASSAVPTMDPACACGIAPDLSHVYVSADLGFRDLFQVSQRAVAMCIVLRAAEAGIPVEAEEGIAAVLTLLCEEHQDPSAGAHPQTGWLTTSHGRAPIHVVAWHDVT